MIRLVVNADDLGLHPEIDAGILRAHREGIVTSATVLVTGPTAPDAIRAAKRQGLALGVHLCLASSLPCAAPAREVRSVAPNGRFRAKWPDVVRAFVVGGLRLAEVAQELSAQVALARELGAEPDHLDAHQHLHVMPGLREKFEALAAQEQLPLRWPSERPAPRWARSPGAALKSALLLALARVPSAAAVRRVPAVGIFEAGRLNLETLLTVLTELPDGDFELGCHPGAKQVRVPEDPKWTYGWTQELEALTHANVREVVEARNIRLTTYAGLTSA